MDKKIIVDENLSVIFNLILQVFIECPQTAEQGRQTLITVSLSDDSAPLTYLRG